MKQLHLIYTILFLILGIVLSMIGFIEGGKLYANHQEIIHQEEVLLGPFHISKPQSLSEFERIESLTNSLPSQAEFDNIQSAIVNHHLFAPHILLDTLITLQTNEEIPIVLIGPNHFDLGNGNAISSLYHWETPFGIVENNREIVSKLIDTNVITIDERVFRKEHSIFNIVGFIKKVAPNATIIPITIKENLQQEEAFQLAQKLHQILPENAKMIASIDFSHYMYDDIADFHDTKTRAVIENFDYKNTRPLDIDASATLEVIMKYSELREANDFKVLHHTSAADLLEDKNTIENTSYINGVFQTGNKTKNENITIHFAGDMMFDRYVRIKINNEGFETIFQHIQRFLPGSDIVVGNLEGTITDKKPFPLDPDMVQFTFDPLVAPHLKKEGFTDVSLGNNHSRDFGKDGYNQTLQYLEENNIGYFGDAFNTQNISIIKEVRGQKIGLIAYHQLFDPNTQSTLDEIQNIRDQVDFLIVFPHWGLEYKLKHNSHQERIAKEFIDAGADMIIGAHPHVTQDIQIYNNKVIIYSLGNFVFDQIAPLTDIGLSAGIVYNPEEVKISLFPVQLRNMELHLLTGDEKKEVLQRIIDNSDLPDDIKNSILNGSFSIPLTSLDE